MLSSRYGRYLIEKLASNNYYKSLLSFRRPSQFNWENLPNGITSRNMEQWLADVGSIDLLEKKKL